MTTGFALNHYKSLKIYFNYVKRQELNDFLKDVESNLTGIYKMACNRCVHVGRSALAFGPGGGA